LSIAFIFPDLWTWLFLSSQPQISTPTGRNPPNQKGKRSVSGKITATTFQKYHLQSVCWWPPKTNRENHYSFSTEASKPQTQLYSTFFLASTDL